jgi:hypothetical protein
MSSSSPILVEPGVKYFFNQTLKQCNVKRNNLYNTLCNLGLFAVFISIILSVLYYKKQNKKTEAELEEEERQNQQIILSKIGQYNDVKLRESQELITNLPLMNAQAIMLQGYSYYK